MNRIVNTCNFGKDEPLEWFLNCEPMSFDDAEAVCRILNRNGPAYQARTWRVVALDYVLSKGFQP